MPDKPVVLARPMFMVRHQQYDALFFLLSNKSILPSIKNLDEKAWCCIH